MLRKSADVASPDLAVRTAKASKYFSHSVVCPDVAAVCPEKTFVFAPDIVRAYVSGSAKTQMLKLESDCMQNIAKSFEKKPAQGWPK